MNAFQELNVFKMHLLVMKIISATIRVGPKIGLLCCKPINCIFLSFYLAEI